MHVLGIDAGGTKTVCLLANERGQILNDARGPGATLHVMADDDVARTLRDVITGATDGQTEAPAAICVGMSGVDRPGEPERISLVLSGIRSGAPVLVVNDALIALEAGAPGSPGIVVVAGTGSMVYGRNANGRAARAGGWGYVLGDEGSGYWMGRQALQAVVRAADERGPATALTSLVLEHWGVGRPRDLVREIYTSDPKPATIARLAFVVQKAADAGDDVARSIIDQGAAELSGAAVSVAARLGLTDAPIVLAGSLLGGMPRLRTAVIARLADRLPRAPARPLEDEPAVGAVRLALALAHGGLRLPSYDV